MDSGRFQPQQRMAWENFGVAFGTILVNEMEGMEWVTVIDGKEEYPALQFMNSDMLIDPAAIVWNKAKKNLPCDLKAEFKKIKREAKLCWMILIKKENGSIFTDRRTYKIVW